MNKLSITEGENTFKLKTPNGEFEFSKNKENTVIFQLLHSVYQSEKLQIEKIVDQILPQYFYSIQTIDLLGKWQENEAFGKSQKYEEMQHYLIEWNFFLQDMMKAMEIEIPEGIYNIH